MELPVFYKGRFRWFIEGGGVEIKVEVKIKVKIKVEVKVEVKVGR